MEQNISMETYCYILILTLTHQTTTLTHKKSIMKKLEDQRMMSSTQGEQQTVSCPEREKKATLRLALIY